MVYKMISHSNLELTSSIAPFETVENFQAAVEKVRHITTNGEKEFTVVAITLHFEHEKRTAPSQMIRLQRSIAYFLENLRSLVRKTDVVFLLHHTFYFVLLTTNQQTGNIVQTRLWDALLWRIHNTSDPEILRPYSITIGHSAYPTPCKDIKQCLEDANEPVLSSDVQPEKSTRKTSTRQANVSQQIENDELPTLARRLGIPYLSLLPKKLPKQIHQFMNPSLAQELQCYPLGRDGGALTVAMSNPQDRTVLDRLQQETGLTIFPVLVHARELQTVLDRLI